jgi:hypothetical protein
VNEADDPIVPCILRRPARTNKQGLSRINEKTRAGIELAQATQFPIETRY